MVDANGAQDWARHSALPDLSLPERLFLIAHDVERGLPRFALDVLGIGLVGAALLELTAARCIGVFANGHLGRTANYGHDDGAAQYILGQIMKLEERAGSDRTPSAVIAAERDYLYNGVADGLVRRDMFGNDRESIRNIKNGRFVPAYGAPRVAAEEAAAWCYALYQRPDRIVGSRDVPLHLACLIAVLGVGTMLTSIPPSQVQDSHTQLTGVCEIQHVKIIQAIGAAVSGRAMVPRR